MPSEISVRTDFNDLGLGQFGIGHLLFLFFFFLFFYFFCCLLGDVLCAGHAIWREGALSLAPFSFPAFSRHAKTGHSINVTILLLTFSDRDGARTFSLFSVWNSHPAL